MRKLSSREKWVWVALALILAAGIFHVSERVLWHGVFSWELRQPEYAELLFEMAVLFAVFFLACRLIGDIRLKLAVIAAAAAVFLWIHVILLPLAVSGAYLLYLCAAGRGLRRLLGADVRQKRLGGRDFLVGSQAVIGLFCVMSAAGIGSIPFLCAAVLAGAALMAAAGIRRGRSRKGADGVEGSVRTGTEDMAGHSRAGANDETNLPRMGADDTPGGPWKGTGGADRAGAAARGRWSAGMSLAAAFVLTVFCLQAGRMNISVDYDSLWYGVRSAFILDNGRGIYENLGTVGAVYTYSKGWETLTLPLSILPSYSFLISMNLWLAAGVWILIRRIAGYFMNRRMSLLLGTLLISLPCIMNMALTAKPDMATLFVQLLMIRELLRFLAPEKSGEKTPGPALYYALAAFLMSWTFKPTALVFSTAVCGMSLLYLLAAGRLTFRCGKRERAEAAGVTALALGELTGIWARTWILTGLPVTSVFSSLLVKLGFKMKYPFVPRVISDSTAGTAFGENVQRLAARLYGLILNPDSSPDMAHVIIAWGSLLIWFAIWTAAACLLMKKKERDPAKRRLDGWLNTVFFSFLAVNVLSLYLLDQVDGNYFMLFYVLLGLAVFRLFARLRSDSFRRALAVLSVPVAAFSAFFMTLSNWAWSVGLSPVNVVNRGYFDHLETRHAEMAAEGKGTIWTIVAEDPRNRLAVFGDPTRDLQFPCCAQSAADISGDTGNLALTSTMGDFMEYAEYSGMDYVFLNANWARDKKWVWNLIDNLVEYGYLSPVCYESDNMLARVCPDGQADGGTETRLREFLDWRGLCLGY